MSGLPDDDPGWGSTRSVLGGMFLPMWRTHRRPPAGESALLTIRKVFLSFSMALVSFLFVLTVIDTSVEDPPFSPTAAALGVLAIGFVQVFVSWQFTRDLPCDIGGLLGMYRTRFFLRIAFAEAAALIGFTLVFITGSLLPYLAGLIPAAVGFARLAPTRANLQREDERLRDRSCPHSLYRLLCEAKFGDAAQ